MNMIEAQAPAQTRASRALAFVGGFHLWMAFAISALLIISLAGCALTGIELPDLGAWVIVFLLLSAMLLPLPAYWYEKGRADLLDSALTVLWAFLLRLIIPILVQVAARLRMPLRDSFFGRADDHLGVSVPAIMAWAGQHWLGNLLNRSYTWVVILLPLAVLLPVLAGRLRYAKEFLVANLISFAIGIPVFAILPAIGPWRYYHLPPTQSQTAFCEGPLLALRLPGAYVLGSHEAGVVCFPSFHVAWAVIIAAALWGFRSLRIPLTLVTGMVVLSTLTTGWHYFVDVLGGILLAIISIVLAKGFTRRTYTIRRHPEEAEASRSAVAFRASVWMKCLPNLRRIRGARMNSLWQLGEERPGYPRQ
jgi:membrane-associated phospholipid phosphatase